MPEDRHGTRASEIAAPTARPTIDALTGVRAVAAGWVVYHHFRRPFFELFPALGVTGPWAEAGYLGVEVFFVLSGFIISYNYAEALARFGGRKYRAFLTARFARVYPVHLATLLMTGVLVAGAAVAGIALNSQDSYTLTNFVGNVLVLQAFPGVAAWNPPSWSISCEAAAYLAFPLLAGVVARMRRRRAITYAVAVLVAELLVIGLIASLRPFSPVALPVVWTRIAGEFTLGCLLWAVWRAGIAARRRWDVVALGSVVAGGLVIGLVDPFGPGAFLTLPFVALVVLSCASATGPVARLLASRPLRWFGRISYSVYLTHFLVMVVLTKVAGPVRFLGEPPAVRVLVLLGYLAAVCLAGAVAYYAVEEPSRRLIRRLGTRRRPRRAEALGSGA